MERVKKYISASNLTNDTIMSFYDEGVLSLIVLTGYFNIDDFNDIIGSLISDICEEYDLEEPEYLPDVILNNGKIGYISVKMPFMEGVDWGKEFWDEFKILEPYSVIETALNEKLSLT